MSFPKGGRYREVPLYLYGTSYHAGVIPIALHAYRINLPGLTCEDDVVGLCWNPKPPLRIKWAGLSPTRALTERSPLTALTCRLTTMRGVRVVALTNKRWPDPRPSQRVELGCCCSNSDVTLACSGLNRFSFGSWSLQKKNRGHTESGQSSYRPCPN